ncbi:type II secretory pathway predicted ATPase ExeA [Plasticicumulans lactativorans]|uniref:Type II secretory pathway predicted ATPase ExeA n=1 Tax=Plasticicumulans lactativorans TaxID=1133106 RepID=A0A4V2SCU6_9GAMM|nr:AAA family ATPase [Plasticicumulans lactativorans]TCO80680.1 type II secretory pathway predicted ATPase ExeA [Plasticicumulans lactativorans]
MYINYFGFTRPPFGDPEPGDFEPVGAQATALETLRVSLDDQVRLLVLTGPSGTGKTSLLRRLIAEQAGRRHCILFWNAHLGFDDLLNYLCDDLDLRAPGTSRAERLKALRIALVREIAAGKSLLLLLDDAQNLPDETLEGLATLLDITEVGRHPVQVVLCGQPTLGERLEATPLGVAPRHLRLRTLAPDECRTFIERRVLAAGHPGGVFDAGAIAKITELAHGVPRLLNRICNQSLLLAYLGSEHVVTAALVRDVAADTPATEAPRFGAPPPPIEPMPARPALEAAELPAMHAPEHAGHVAHAAVDEPPPAPLPEVHADPAEIGHRPLPVRRRTGVYLSFGIGLLAAATLAAFRLGWLPPALDAPLRELLAAVGGPARGVPAAAPAHGAATAGSAPTPAPAAAPARPVAAAAIAPPANATAAASAVTATPPAPPAASPHVPAGQPAVVADTAPTAPPAGTETTAERPAAAVATPAAATAETAPARPATAPPPVAAPAVTATDTPAPTAAPAATPTITVIATAPAAAATPDTPETSPALASAVRALLAQARNQMATLRYTQPPGDNAMQTYREVLALAPGNDEAEAGLAQIRGKFQQWAASARARGETERAIRYLGIAASIAPEDAALRQQLDELRARGGEAARP